MSKQRECHLSMSISGNYLVSGTCILLVLIIGIVYLLSSKSHVCFVAIGSLFTGIQAHRIPNLSDSELVRLQTRHSTLMFTNLGIRKYEWYW